MRKKDSAELEKLRQQIQDVEAQKQKEQLNALQNQINPHFLYNTLDTIRGMAIEESAFDVADVVTTLSAMFKYSMEYTDSVVPVSDELTNLNSYLKIQSIRFPGKFEFEKIMECETQELSQVQMPKMVLQPLVENIFTHAFHKKATGGKIILRLISTNEDFKLIISDNGSGISDEQVLRLNQMFLPDSYDSVALENNGTGIALHNIDLRIKFYCGKGYGLHVASTVGYGTDITISLPLSPKTDGAAII